MATLANHNKTSPTGIGDVPGLVDVMSSRQKVQLYLLLSLWLAAVILFWTWWLDRSHMVGSIRFLVNSLVLSWSVVVPGYYFFFVSCMKRPNPALPIPSGLTVAMVVTKAPSEPFSMVRKTLEAMLAQKYPHDTWLADEDPTPETIAWCEEHQVLVSTRRGIAEYHRPTWPRRTRCKEGNLAYFYDTYGYERYDYVVQMDADHWPGPGYLEEMLRPFADPAVGYVSAPSVCDNNAAESWAARARLYGEALLHGSLQAGYNGGWAPLCIGSHYAVRTSALRQIGGLGPELAEDHSTTLMMNAHGWRGVHALEAEAHGDGPMSFADCMTQEFQWSRSLVTLLLTLTPQYWGSLPPKLRFQFLFSQLWYPFFGIMMAIAHLIPIIALLTRRPLVSVSYIAFLFYAALLTFSITAIAVWVKKNGWLRPANSKILSWEALLFQLTRWPWALLGSIAAVVGVVRQKESEFRVTPKGVDATSPLPARALLPYVLVTVLSASAAVFLSDVASAQGYYYFAILNSLSYSFVVFAVIGRHAYENRR